MILTLLARHAIIDVKLISAVLCKNCGHSYYINIIIIIIII